MKTNIKFFLGMFLLSLLFLSSCKDILNPLSPSDSIENRNKASNYRVANDGKIVLGKKLEIHMQFLT